jgi:hypothetical protein
MNQTRTMKAESEIELADPSARVAYPDAKLVPLLLLSKRLGRNHGSLLKKVDKLGLSVFYFRPRRDYHPKLAKALQPADAVALILSYIAEGFALPTTDPKTVSELWDTLKGATPESRELVESVIKDAIKEVLARRKKSLAHRKI